MNERFTSDVKITLPGLFAATTAFAVLTVIATYSIGLAFVLFPLAFVWLIPKNYRRPQQA